MKVSGIPWLKEIKWRYCKIRGDQEFRKYFAPAVYQEWNDKTQVRIELLLSKKLPQRILNRTLHRQEKIPGGQVIEGKIHGFAKLPPAIEKAIIALGNNWHYTVPEPSTIYLDTLVEGEVSIDGFLQQMANAFRKTEKQIAEKEIR